MCSKPGGQLDAVSEGSLVLQKSHRSQSTRCDPEAAGEGGVRTPRLGPQGRSTLSAHPWPISCPAHLCGDTQKRGGLFLSVSCSGESRGWGWGKVSPNRFESAQDHPRCEVRTESNISIKQIHPAHQLGKEAQSSNGKGSCVVVVFQIFFGVCDSLVFETLGKKLVQEGPGLSTRKTRGDPDAFCFWVLSDT